MTRWHKPSCISPDVVVDANNIPNCRSCRRSCPSVEELIVKQAGTNSVLELPPDQPPGQMNLWWPMAVPYESNGDRSLREQASPTKDDVCLDSALSGIYQETLKTNEFRLACLSAVVDKESPVHVTLEVYTDEDHPEYECTSYTWGGEDEDSTLCYPIYVGPYWDVLLQTKNCHSLLRFMRPWRGIRMVWIDAICINQNSLIERTTQVAKMKFLYAECNRVVVYLGEDLVTCSAQFPKSQSLEFLEVGRSPFPPGHSLHGSSFGLDQLLSRRYFSRLWVIQELIVSQRASIRIGDVDFRADASVIDRLQNSVPYAPTIDMPSETNPIQTSRQNHRWNLSPAPWIQHLAHGFIPAMQVTGVLNLLQLTAQSHASVSQSKLKIW
jgi:hypothetical protein